MIECNAAAASTPPPQRQTALCDAVCAAFNYLITYFADKSRRGNAESKKKNKNYAPLLIKIQTISARDVDDGRVVSLREYYI